MQLTRLMVPENKYGIKCPYSMKPNGICVHNTANKASAMAEVSYMVGNNNKVSYHYAIDNQRIVQGIEENRNAWHAGDGTNGKGNRNKIAIEICHSINPDISMFTASEMLAAKFIAYLLKKYNWGIEEVSKHQDYSGKYCPHKTLDLGWERFLNLIRTELGQVLNTSNEITYSTIQKGSQGNLVRIAQEKLIAKGYSCGPDGIDGIFGKDTLSATEQLQRDAKIAVDGVIGPDTWAVLNSDFVKPNKPTYPGYLIKKGQISEDVGKVQARLIELGYSCGRCGVDNDFGKDTAKAVEKFQKDNGLVADKIVGPKTWNKLF